MRVTIYDRNPGAGLGQWFLKASWAVGCWLQKRLGLVDDYYGAASWLEAAEWLRQHEGPFQSIQYWGHGSPGLVWLAGKSMPEAFFAPVKPKLTADSTIWFRCCSVFCGAWGQEFSRMLADSLGCVIAGHTVTIGPWQGGLHTRKPFTSPSWPATEREPGTGIPVHLLPVFPNTIFCLTTTIPEGW